MQKLNIKNGSIAIILLLHAVGLLGLNSGYRELFLALTPINLFLSFVILFINQQEKNKAFILFCSCIFVLGFSAEVIGVKTGLLFGVYTYGNTLGLKLFNVPLIIGVNWLILVYAAGTILHKLPLHILLKSLIGAAMLTILDVLIEPVAIKFDFWHWENGNIPMQNYIAWFIISFIFLLLYNKFQFNKNNLPAKVLYIVQIVFFIVLNLI